MGVLLAAASLAAAPTGIMGGRAKHPRPMPLQRLPDAGVAKDAGVAATDSGVTQAPGQGCNTNPDCLLLRTPPGGCCETLCTPRAVLKTDAKLIRDQEECKHADLKKCAIPNCAPPPGGESVAVCVKNRCVIQRVNTD